MSLLDRVRERTGSDLSDGELQALIEGISAELDARLGSAGPMTVELGDVTDPYSSTFRTLKLPRPADPAQPMTVTEIDPGNSGAALSEMELTAQDYRLLHGGQTLQRLTTGSNPRYHWAPLVRVTFTPVGDAAVRQEAVIRLAQLDLSYRGGLKSEKAGDHQFTLTDDPAAEREKLIASLAPRTALVMG